MIFDIVNSAKAGEKRYSYKAVWEVRRLNYGHISSHKWVAQSRLCCHCPHIYAYSFTCKQCVYDFRYV